MKVCLLVATFIIEHAIIITSKDIIQPKPKFNNRQMVFTWEEDSLPNGLDRTQRNPKQFCGMSQTDSSFHLMTRDLVEDSRRKKRVQRSEDNKYTLEVAVFVDDAMRKKLVKETGSERSAKDKVIATMNEVQQRYGDPSLEVRIDITVVKVQFLTVNMGNPDKDMRVSTKAILDDFRKWQARQSGYNWDLALLLTGLHAYYVFSGGSTADVGGAAYDYGEVCTRNTNVVFFTSLSPRGIAHEIGHSLSALHDGISNSCSESAKTVMSWIPYESASTWSQCSSNEIRNFLRSGKASCLKRKGNPKFNWWEH